MKPNPTPLWFWTQIITLEGNHEIVSLTGTLSEDGVHLHISLADGAGKVVGGHVVGECFVFTTAEVVLGTLQNVKFVRAMDSETGFGELAFRPTAWTWSQFRNFFSRRSLNE